MLVRPTTRRSEQGTVLMAGIFGLVVLLAFGALVVDLLRMQRIGLSVQRAIDAASIAAAKGMKGDPYNAPSLPADKNAAKEGWITAKRAFIMALRLNLIAEGENGLAAGEGWTQGTTGIPDFHDPDSPYSSTEFILPDLRITIERGAWLYDEEDSDTDGDPSTGPYFVPLESGDGNCPADAFCLQTEENYLYANGVRVRIQSRSIRSFFPLAWAGTTEFGGTVREAIASVQALTLPP